VTVLRRAMVLAAGRGERMRPLTMALPKPLLTVAGKALIDWHLESLCRGGIREVAINTSWLGSMLVDALRDGARFGLTLRWFDEGPEPLETAGGIINALPFFRDEPFAVVNADVFTAYPLPPPAPSAGRLAHLVLVPNPDEHPRGDFGVECGELRLDAPRRYTFAGIASYHPRLFAGLGPRRRALKPVLDRAGAAGLVSAEIYHGVWTDVGTPERLAALNRSLR
jgi:N-acetyl-alpha-D-muramate 1-phosphate uridylyltransferase